MEMIDPTNRGRVETDGDLLGRERESSRLAGLLDGLPARGETLILRGEAGVGKSALLSWAADRARERDMLILRTAGVLSEAQMPFAGLHQLLRPIDEQTDELIIGAASEVLGTLGTTPATPEMFRIALFRIALEVLNLVSDIAAARPLLLLADDVHWLDGPTCEVLAFVARRLEPDRVLLLAAARPEPGTALDRAGLPELTLGGLDPVSSASLLRSRAPDLPARMRDELLSEAAGNPLALVELPMTRKGRSDTTLTTWEPLTGRLEQAFARQVQELPEASRSLLLVAALNDTSSLAEALSCASLVTGATMTLEDLAPAETMRLIDIERDELHFRHPLIRSGTRQAATTSQRHAAHAALAIILADEPERAVWHRAACAVGPDEILSEDLEAVAVRAQIRAGGSEIALMALRRAAELSRDARSRGRRLLDAAELAFEVGRTDIVVLLLGELEQVPLAGPDQGRIRWLEEFLRQGRGEGTVDSLVTIAEEMIEQGKVERAYRCLETAAQKCWWLNADASSRRRVLSVVDGRPDAMDSAKLLAIQSLTDPIGRGAQIVARVSRVPLAVVGDDEAVVSMGQSLTVIPDCDRSSQILQATIDQARAQGKMGVVGSALASLGDAALYSGDWNLALRTTDECIRLAVEAEQPVWKAFALITQAALLGWRGEEDRASAALAEAEPTLAALTSPPMSCYLKIASGAIAIGAGRHAEALDHLLCVFDAADPAYDPLGGSRGLIDLVESAVHVGQREPAERVVEQLEEVLQRNGSSLIRTGLICVRPMLADDGAAEALFETARSELPASKPFLRARVLLSYGAWLRRHRRAAQSRRPLRSARESFDALGAPVWTERARQELRASGESSGRRTVNRRAELTPQEEQIARMAAAGLTNREIGERMFLSHRTVGTHLYKVFPKLGISSRAELADVMSVQV